MTRYTQRKDGEGFAVPSGELYRIACCDCGLVHDFVFISEDGKPIGIAARRNNRATAQRKRNREQHKERDEAWLAITPGGARCHFGEASAARAWAGANGSVKRVALSLLALVTVRQEESK